MKKMQDALIAIRRTPYQSAVAILMVTTTFLVGYIFSLFAFGTSAVLQFFETRPQVIAFFEIDAETEQVETLAETMRQRPYVQDVNVVSKEEALELYRQDHKEDPLLLELVTADILPASVEVSGDTVDSLGQIRTDLEAASGVEDVVYQEDIVTNIRQWTNAVRVIGLIAIAVLGTISFLAIVTLIGMKISARRHAITVMTSIGATSWYVVGPFVMEGVLYGLAGSIIGWSVMYGLLLYATPWLQQFMGQIVSLPLPWTLLAWQFLVGTLLAVLLGVSATFMAARRMLGRSA
jgi:cell division transport system permease protein